MSNQSQDEPVEMRSKSFTPETDIQRLEREVGFWQDQSQRDREKIAHLQKLCEEQKRELDHFKKSGIIEVAVRNPAVAEYMNHWEGRAEKAEKYQAALKRIVDYFYENDLRIDQYAELCHEIAKDALEKK